MSVQEKDRAIASKLEMEEKERLEKGDILSGVGRDFNNLLQMKPPREEAARRNAYTQAFTNGFSQGISPMMRGGMMNRQLPELDRGSDGIGLDGPDF